MFPTIVPIDDDSWVQKYDSPVCVGWWTSSTIVEVSSWRQGLGLSESTPTSHGLMSSHHFHYLNCSSGWWYTNPPEKWSSSSVGNMTFTIYGKSQKSCSKPPTRNPFINGHLFLWAISHGYVTWPVGNTYNVGNLCGYPTFQTKKHGHTHYKLGNNPYNSDQNRETLGPWDVDSSWWIHR